MFYMIVLTYFKRATQGSFYFVKLYVTFEYYIYITFPLDILTFETQNVIIFMGFKSEVNI